MEEDEIICGPSTSYLLRDELDDEDDGDVYMEDDCEFVDEEENDDEGLSNEANMYMVDSSFDYLDEEADLVEENPFEPVYPANAGLLFADGAEDENSPSDENADSSDAKHVQGRVLEAISLDNILPEGSRRRRG